jgi:hypothetical protein
MRGHNSTIERKKKTCKRCGEPNYIFSKGLCNQCWKIENYKEIPDHSDNELDLLINDLDIVFSQYVRLNAAGTNGLVSCYTCGTVKGWKEMQNGHFIPRTNMFLRFDTRNCRPQCETCNCHKHGNIPAFSRNLNEEKIGITEILYHEAQTIYRYSRTELKELISDYTKKVKFLKEDLTPPITPEIP